MKFLDQAKIFLKSGDGGAGACSFRRERFIEFGGPDGGNGGRGGDILFECVDGLNTLIDYRYQQHFKAQKGHHGEGRQKTGADGEDITLKVPAGTQVIDDETEVVLADLTKPGQKIRLLKGGDEKESTILSARVFNRRRSDISNSGIRGNGAAKTACEIGRKHN